MSDCPPVGGSLGPSGVMVPATDETGGGLATDLSLLLRAQHGDAEALEQLVGRITPDLRQWAARMPRWACDVADADDVVQETLVSVLGRLRHFEVRHHYALDAYLRRAVVNRIRSEVRKAKRRPLAATLEAAATSWTDASPLARLLAKDTRGRLGAGLAKLRPMERRAVLGRVGHGWSYQFIAEDLGKPSADAARKVVERALVRLGGLMRVVPARRAAPRSRGADG
jgi:RNA polymerase sigma factor (sigma-70 family)